MNNEEKILSMLDTLISKVDKLEAGQAALEAGQAALKSGQAALEAGQTALEAGQAEIKTDLKHLHAKIDELKKDDQQILNFALNAEEASTKNHKELLAKFDSISGVTQVNTFDIAMLRSKVG
ncbi:MAG: hypothetical protein LBS84_06815 [Clostridiales bacterium]|jgi:exonuclease VII small subunit|nr:hypothetical protein [Clostridiales bacterium]